MYISNSQELQAQVTNNQERIAVLVSNPLSYYWKGRLSGIMPLYIGGMCGYALSLVLRVLELVFLLIKLILEPFFEERPFFEVLGEKFIALLGGVGSILSGAIGIVAPPLAYKIDEWIQSNYFVYSNHATKWLTIPKGSIDVANPMEEFLALWNDPNDGANPVKQAELQALAKFVFVQHIEGVVRDHKFTRDDVVDPEKMVLLVELAFLSILENEHGEKIIEALLPRANIEYRAADNERHHDNFEDYRATILADKDQIIAILNKAQVHFREFQLLQNNFAGFEVLIKLILEYLPHFNPSDKCEEVLADLLKLNNVLTADLRDFHTESLRLAADACAPPKESWGRFLLRPFLFV